jgi:prepilin-type processing-associated H-X9-DG protein
MPDADDSATPSDGARPLDYAAPQPQATRSALLARWGMTGLILLGVGAWAIWVITPSTSASRTQAKRIYCAANLRTLGAALEAYAKSHGGRYPDNLGQLVRAANVNPGDFVCPECADTPARGPTPDAVAADLAAGGHLSYVYAGAGLTTAAHPDTVVLFDHPANHALPGGTGVGDGGNVLFADGHVEWRNRAEFRPLLDRAASGQRPFVCRMPTSGPAATATRPAGEDVTRGEQ